MEDYKEEQLAELENKKNQLRALLEEYQEHSEDEEYLSTDEGQELMRKVSTKEKEINEFETNYSYRVSQKQSVLLNPVMNKLQSAIDEVAKENKYTYILNQTSGSNILYGVEQYDVTNLIVKKLGVSIPD